MPELLVSVRSVREAEAAFAGGAEVIDVKDPNAPTLGSLGRAADRTIAEVIRFISSRCPVSAALGELTETPLPYPAPGLAYVKWGLSGCAEPWDELLQAADHMEQVDPRCRPVAVAYADYQLVQAPSPEEVCDFACRNRWEAFLLDTARKDGRTLLDWLTVCEISWLSTLCHEAGIKVALAGSLGFEEIDRLVAIEPAWFAVRGAACIKGLRSEAIDPQRVRQLVELIK